VLREEHDQRLQDAADAAAAKQKEWMDAVAANALAERIVTEDRELDVDAGEMTLASGEALAAELGLTLPE